MGKLFASVVIAVSLLIGVPATALIVYDVVAVRPCLAEIEGILASAAPMDASPPALVTRLIDANSRSPTPYATRLVTMRLFPRESQGRSHLRNALWMFLLPRHLGEARMYGLYATLAFNGQDHGLSSFAAREYGKALDELSPMQAAETVAMTRAPSIYLRDRRRLEEQASVLLAKAGYTQ